MDLPRTAFLSWVAITACGEATPAGAGLQIDAGRSTASLPYARRVVSFNPGAGAGFGQDRFPDIVLGPPEGGGTGRGGHDVLSLGVGGSIILDFGDKVLIDGPGADLLVFENPFFVSADARSVFAELGEVAVSADGITWYPFDCAIDGDGDGAFPGCAGWTPSAIYDPFAINPPQPSHCGGDAFDLSSVGLAEARLVRITDLADDGSAPSAGFDLDAVGLIHFR
jgi:hypothetical protein